jgi:hypothetical protein
MPHFSAIDLRRCGCALLVLSLTGCVGWDDPFQREGTWRPEHNNDANLGAMVVDPSNFVEGVNDDDSPAVLSAAAVHRLLTDKTKQLITTDSTDAVAASPQAPASTGAAAAGTPQ